MKPVLGHILGRDICEALGLDPHVTTGVVLVAKVGEPALLRVTSTLSRSTSCVEKLMSIVKRYEIVERET